MDTETSTNNSRGSNEEKYTQENILLDIIKEACSDPESRLSKNLVGKVNRIIADCDLTHYASFHKLNTSDESTSTVLGIVQKTAAELTFDEQVELNQAIVCKIQTKIPIYNSELEQLKNKIGNGRKSRKEQISELQQSLDQKLNKLKDQENEKVELMMEWLNHRLNEVTTFSNSSSELLTIKTSILELKSKILHLHILWNVFTETNRSIKAYSEVHKDMKDNIRETEERIKKYKDIISSEYD